LYRKDPKKTSMRKKAKILRDTISQTRKDIRDIKATKRNTVTTVVTARRLATKVNNRTRNRNNKIKTSIIKFANLRYNLDSELDNFMRNESQNSGTFVILIRPDKRGTCVLFPGYIVEVT
jgi:hypothetical protein